jgi:MFS family permease
MLIAQVVGRICGGALWGRVAKKQGSRLAIITVQLANIALALAMIFILGLSNPSNIVYVIVNFFVGISLPAVFVTFVYFSEITEIRKRPRFVVIESAISMPLAFASYLFGIIAEKFGFAPIYIILILGSTTILTVAISKLLKPEDIELINP